MLRKRNFKIISILVINSFLFMDLTCAGASEIIKTDQADCLSPAVQINSQTAVQDFRFSFGLLSSEIKKAKKTYYAANLVRKSANKKSIIASIENNIASGLAIALKIDSVPENLDKWFAGTSDETAAKFIAGFDFNSNQILQKNAQAGLAEFFSGLNEHEKNIIKLKLEQLIRNTKRSVSVEAQKDMRVVVLLGQDEHDPFAARKVLGYSGKNTVYLHINTLIMTEAEFEKEVLGVMLAYQAQIMLKGKQAQALSNEDKILVNQLWSKKKFLGKADKQAEALRLRTETINKYSKYDWMSWFRIPGNLQDYIFPWTQASRDMGKAYRDNFFMPWLAMFSWMSPRNLPINEWLEMNGTTIWPRIMGIMAEQTQRTITWMHEVEQEDTEWGIDFKVVLQKPNSYRLLEFSREGYPIDEKALPVIIVNPNAGHDSTVGKDLVDTFLKKGQRVFAFDWQSADPKKPEMVADLVKNVTDCINHVPGPVQVAALCQGGWVSASAEALLASLNPDKVAAAYMAAVPFYTTLGDNEITETVKNMPEWFFSMLVFYLGVLGVQDGAHQMGGFENMGDKYQKQIGYWMQLIQNIDNEKDLERARGFIKWYYRKYLNLSLWYLEAVLMHFMGNDIYEGRYRTQVGHELRTVDLSKIAVTLILLSGTKDDVTVPGTILKETLAEILNGDIENTDAAWEFLIRQGFISDKGEGNVNREQGVKAVVENKILRLGLSEFLALEDQFIDDNSSILLAAIFFFLKEECYGQCRALREVAGTPRDQILEIIMNRGHIGVFSGSEGSEARIKWQEAIDWAKEKIAENYEAKKNQQAKNNQADKNRVISSLQRRISRRAAEKLQNKLFPFTGMMFVEQAI